MTEMSTPTTSRRRLLKTLLYALPALAVLRYVRPTEDDEIVEVGGWILKRSDLA